MSEPDAEAQKWLGLKTINFALMSGATMFLGVIILISYPKEPSTNLQEGFFVFATIVGALWFGSLLVKSQLSRLFEKKFTVEDPFPAYQTFTIIRMGVTEGPALVGLVALFLFAPGADASQYPRLAVFLLPYLSLLFTGLFHRPSEADLKERVRVAKENQSFRN